MTHASQPSKLQVGAVLLLGIGSVSTASILIRLALDAAGTRGVGFSLVLAASRLALAALFLAPAWRGLQVNSTSWQTWRCSIAAGVCLGLHFATWITSLSYTSVAASTTLVTTNPIWVALLSWVWFRERPTLKTTIGIILALAGGILVALGGSASSLSSNPPLGNFLALVGSWAISLYLLLGREAQRQGMSIGHHVALTYSTAAIVLLPLPLLLGAKYTGYAPAVYLWIGLMALFPQLLGHTSFNWALRWISPTLVTLTILAEPVGSSILSFLVFQENPGQTVIFGAVVILAGVTIAAFGSNRPAGAKD